MRAASSTDQVMQAWNPPLRDPNRDQEWERIPATARIRDLATNEGLAAGVIDRPLAMAVGRNFRFSPRAGLIAKRLRITSASADVLASEISAAWESWADDPLERCDWEGEQTFGGMVNLLTRNLFGAEGEGLGVMRWSEQPGWAWRTALQVVDPDRLSTPRGQGESATMFNGVETDGRRIVAYHIQNAHPYDYSSRGGMTWERVPARMPWGRPVVLHLKDKTRAGQKRGISKLVTVLRKFKMLQRFTDSEIQAAAVNALFAGVIKTRRTTGELAQSLQVADMQALAAARNGYYKGSDAQLSDGSRLVRLYPEDDMELLTAQRYGGSFAAFVAVVLQHIAAGLGISYEQLSMDFSKTNYSSYRGAMLETWRTITALRDLVAQRVGNPALLCVVEEGLNNGVINAPAGAPGLYENPAGWLAGRWIGPGRGWVDPVKEVTAAQMRIASGMSTLEDEIAETTGGDLESIAQQLAYERDLFGKYGLKPVSIAELLGVANATATLSTPDTAPLDPSQQGNDVGAGA